LRTAAGDAEAVADVGCEEGGGGLEGGGAGDYRQPRGRRRPGGGAADGGGGGQDGRGCGGQCGGDGRGCAGVACAVLAVVRAAMGIAVCHRHCCSVRRGWCGRAPALAGTRGGLSGPVA